MQYDIHTMSPSSLAAVNSPSCVLLEEKSPNSPSSKTYAPKIKECQWEHYPKTNFDHHVAEL
jgi:hypothetical protein